MSDRIPPRDSKNPFIAVASQVKQRMQEKNAPAGQQADAIRNTASPRNDAESNPFIPAAVQVKQRLQDKPLPAISNTAGGPATARDGANEAKKVRRKWIIGGAVLFVVVDVLAIGYVVLHADSLFRSRPGGYNAQRLNRTFTDTIPK